MSGQGFQGWEKVHTFRKHHYGRDRMGLIKDQCTASSYCSLYIGIDLTTNDYFSDDSNRSENSHSECHHIPSTRHIGMHVKPLLSLSKGDKENIRKKLKYSTNIPKVTQNSRNLRKTFHSLIPSTSWMESNTRHIINSWASQLSN